MNWTYWHPYGVVPTWKCTTLFPFAMPQLISRFWRKLLSLAVLNLL
jgi:hypothetical protein